MVEVAFDFVVVVGREDGGGFGGSGEIIGGGGIPRKYQARNLSESFRCLGR